MGRNIHETAQSVGATRPSSVRRLFPLLLSALFAMGCSGPRPPAQKLPMELLKNYARRNKKSNKTASLAGVVLGPDGRPVDGALIAAVRPHEDPEAGNAPLLTVSKDRGKFEFVEMPPGDYGITVTAPRSPGNVPLPAGSYAGVITVAAGAKGPPVLVRLGPPGRTFQGVIKNSAGAPLEGALVRAVRESPFEGDSFFAATDKQGRFVMGLSAAKYFLLAQAENHSPVRLDLDNTESASGLSFTLSPAPVLPSKEIVSEWVNSSGSVISSPEDVKSEELVKLREIVGDASIVGLGETTFTGGEIARLRTQFFKSLVWNLGFSVLLIEATQADVRALDNYLVHGTGRLSDHVAALGTFSIDTEEALSLFAWMRKHNEDPKHFVKLRVRGIDVGRSAAAASSLSDYLIKMDKVFYASVEDTLLRLHTNEFGPAFRDRPADEQEVIVNNIERIIKTLEKNRRVYIPKGTDAAFAKATDDVLALRWALRVYRDEKERGRALFATADRTLASLPKNTKVALWAHASQISRFGGAQPQSSVPRSGGVSNPSAAAPSVAAPSAAAPSVAAPSAAAGATSFSPSPKESAMQNVAEPSMGAGLSAKYGAAYLPMAFTFYQGWIRAWDFTTGPTKDRGTKLFRLPPADKGSLEGLLDLAGQQVFYADVRKAPPPLKVWFDVRIPMRNVGSVFVAPRYENTRVVVSQSFDALVFIHKLTTVRFNETGKRPGKKE